MRLLSDEELPPLDYEELPKAETRPDDDWKPVECDVILATLYGFAGLITGAGLAFLYMGVR